MIRFPLINNRSVRNRSLTLRLSAAFVLLFVLSEGSHDGLQDSLRVYGFALFSVIAVLLSVLRYRDQESVSGFLMNIIDIGLPFSIMAELIMKGRVYGALSVDHILIALAILMMGYKILFRSRYDDHDLTIDSGNLLINVPGSSTHSLQLDEITSVAIDNAFLIMSTRNSGPVNVDLKRYENCDDAAEFIRNAIPESPDNREP